MPVIVGNGFVFPGGLREARDEACRRAIKHKVRIAIWLYGDDYYLRPTNKAPKKAMVPRGSHLVDVITPSHAKSELHQGAGS
jgi:hypothetical protein